MNSDASASPLLSPTTAAASAAPAYVFDVAGGGFSLVVWGALVASIVAIGGHALRGLCSTDKAAASAVAAPPRRRLSCAGLLLLLVYLSLLVCAALATWIPMLRMVGVDMQRSGYGAGESSSYTLTEFVQWLTSAKAHRKDSLFFVAYKNVCDTPAAWYVSSQLLLFVLSYAAWLWLEGPSCGLVRGRGLACLWIGFAGAISASLAAVQAAATWTRFTRPTQTQAVSRQQQKQPSSQQQQPPSMLLWLCILLGVLTLPVLRYGVSHEANDVPRAFKISLLVGHLALLLPFLQSAAPASSTATSRYSPAAALRVVLLYAFLAGLSLSAHLESIAHLWPSVRDEAATRLSSAGGGAAPLSVLQSFVSAWYARVWPSSSVDALAQQSIGMDVVLVYALLAVWVATEASTIRQRMLWAALVLLSAASLGLLAPISLLLPLFLLQRTLQESTATDQSHQD